MRRCQACVLLLAMMSCTYAASGATPPTGLEAVARFDRLAELRDYTRTLQASSHAPDGGNGDTGKYRYVVGDEQVLIDAIGPGCVYRMWFTGQNNAGLIRIYLDQAATPAVEMTMADFFSGTVAPFLAPLVANDNVSSGGFMCYLPIPFRTGCRITTTGGGHYYNITYQMYANESLVTTFSGQEDSTAARTLWQNVTHDPKPESGTQIIADDMAIPAGATVTPADISGAGMIQSLELTLPGMTVPDTTPVTDDGRAFKDKVNFRVAIDPANAGVRLVRRIDYGIGNQKGGVYVDGAFAGEWFTPGSASNRFLDTEFDVPANLTAGKAQLDVEIQFISSNLDWNEFRYWVQSKVGDQYVQTDELDVGQTASETAHQYVITNPVWNGTRTFSYYSAPTGPFRELLEKTRLVITWDGDATPAVDAPLAFFFGAGVGPARVRALPVGMIADRLYCYFPMPYATGARVQLINESTQPIDALQFALSYTPSGQMPAEVGYFHALFRTEAPTTSGRDYTFLDATGTGHLVGVVEHMHSNDGSRWYLEGDERIHVDGNLTPSLYGTGTEDFYNGGWYFNRGIFDLQTHGNPVHETTSGDTTVAYRFFLSDLIPFNASIHVGIEHGATNDFNDDISSVAYYYLRPEVTVAQTDELDINNNGSESAHAYSVTNGTWAGSLTDEYEGDDDNISVTDTGRRLAVTTGQSTFTLVITRGCRAVMLRRRMDYNITNQMARVYADNELAGVWYDAGNNTVHRMRDSEFLIPTALTANKSQLSIRIENASDTAEWTEFHYWAFSYYPPPPPVKGDFDLDGDVDQEDFGHLQACLTGAVSEPPLPGCADALLNGDAYVDQADLLIFLQCFNGPNNPPAPSCPE